MNQKAIQTIKPTLGEVQDQFRIWRKTRKKRTSIPRDLWQAAIEQTQYCSINIVSKALGLSYTDLKRRVKASRTDVCSRPSPVVAVEVVDFRKGIDRLAQLCREVIGSDPFSGHIFVFRNRRKTAIKIL